MSVLKNLLKVKSIVTLALILTFCYETIKGNVPMELFGAMVGAVVTYFFNKVKNNKDDTQEVTDNGSES